MQHLLYYHSYTGGFFLKKNPEFYKNLICEAFLQFYWMQLFSFSVLLGLLVCYKFCGYSYEYNAQITLQFIFSAFYMSWQLHA